MSSNKRTNCIKKQHLIKGAASRNGEMPGFLKIPYCKYMYNMDNFGSSEPYVYHIYMTTIRKYIMPINNLHMACLHTIHTYGINLQIASGPLLSSRAAQ
jgi:hypothetical protein